jgi:hypothetical protein
MRTVNQDLLLAVCNKMGEVIPLLTDSECGACIGFMKEMYGKATTRVEAVSSPAYQKLSLRELFTEKAAHAHAQAQTQAAQPEKKKKVKPARAPVPRVSRKRSPAWQGEDEEGPAAPSPKKTVVKPQRQAQGLSVWDTRLHAVVVAAEAYDAGLEALVVRAKGSLHGRAKEHRVLLPASVVDQVRRGYWQMLRAALPVELPASFRGTAFGRADSERQAEQLELAD